MKKTDFNMLKLSFNINIDIENSLRSISENVKLLNHFRNTDALTEVAKHLDDIDGTIESIVYSLCSDDSVSTFVDEIVDDQLK